MGEVLTAFGIDKGLIVAQVFNFVILAGALWYFLYTPVLKIISEREEKIKKGVEDAFAAEKARESSEIERVGVLKDAHLEASHIVSRALVFAEEKQRSLLDEAQEKIARERSQLTLEAEQLKVKTIKESESEIAKMAILTAEQILKKELSK